MQGRGIYSDFLLALDRPCEALKVLDGLHRDGVRGEYLTSRLLAALACGADAPFREGAAEIAASTDPQLHWEYALWLAQQGRAAEAAAELRAWKERAASSAIQWTLGGLDGLPARVPLAQRPGVATFVREVEAFLRSDDEELTLAPALQRLIDSLEGSAR